MDDNNPLDAVNTFLAGIGLAAHILFQIKQNKRERSQDRTNALIALSDAYHETESYYSYLASNPRSPERESKVAGKWAAAGFHLAKFDEPIAEKLHLKSRYWRESTTWDENAIKQAGIALEPIRRDVTLLLQSR